MVLFKRAVKVAMWEEVVEGGRLLISRYKQPLTLGTQTLFWSCNTGAHVKEQRAAKGTAVITSLHIHLCLFSASTAQV